MSLIDAKLSCLLNPDILDKTLLFFGQTFRLFWGSVGWAQVEEEGALMKKTVFLVPFMLNRASTDPAKDIVLVI